jgi:hypothetical protein
VALVVSPRAGDSHKVGSEFTEDQFQLLMCWFPSDTCQDRMRHLGLDAVGGHSIGHGCSIKKVLMAQRGGVLYVVMMTLMTPIKKGGNDPKPVLGVSSHVRNGCAGYDSGGSFDCRLCCKFKLQFHSLLGWYAFWKGRGLDSEVL